ncbi:MAG TPA: hypothetical protein VF746_01410 [Longimicrobium sp.]|jgi:Na+-transporting methylmalonyl-CoA/oxaloacetate decarboxylase gamma subunit
MDVLVRRWVEWKGRRKAAQVIIYDGAAEYEKTRSFVRGIALGALGMTVVFALTAPTAVDPQLVEQSVRRQTLLMDANRRADEAVEVANLCLRTASSMEQTLHSYQEMLRKP